MMHLWTRRWNIREIDQEVDLDHHLPKMFRHRRLHRNEYRKEKGHLLQQVQNLYYQWQIGMNLSTSKIVLCQFRNQQLRKIGEKIHVTIHLHIQKQVRRHSQLQFFLEVSTPCQVILETSPVQTRVL